MSCSRKLPCLRGYGLILAAVICCASGQALVAQTRSSTSQDAETEAVSQLRRVLAATYPTPAERDRAIKQCLTALHSLADLRGAAALMEWRGSASDPETAAVDRANYTAVVAWFTRAVRQILHQNEAANTVAILDMLGRMAGQARASGEPLTLVRPFAADVADLVQHAPLALRGVAARTLAQMDPPVFLAVPALSELLRSQDAALRRAAADAFVVFLQNAVQATGEGANLVRPAARQELVLAASTVVPAVHVGLDDVRPEVRRRCLECIGLACAGLTHLMEEPARVEDASSARPLEVEYDELAPLLQALRDQGPILDRFLHDPDPQTRILTHKALEELAVARSRWLQLCAIRRESVDEKLLQELLHQAVPVLAEELAHPDVRVRRSALDVLETSGPLALPALPALARALQDPDRFVRWSAVRTVGKLGPSAAPQSLANLHDLLHDSDEELRKAAANALERLRAQNESPR